jgi:hypothetical protein
MARTKLQGENKGASKAKFPAKQRQGNRHSRPQDIAAAAAAGTALPVTVPTADGVALPTGSLGTVTTSGISAPSATAAATAVMAAAACSKQRA